MVSIGVIGNCQAEGISDALAALTGAKTSHYRLAKAKDGRVKDILAARHDWHVVMQHKIKIERSLAYPVLTFKGYHPDCAHVFLDGPLGRSHSTIAMWAHGKGLDVAKTIGLFRADVFEHLGYFDQWQLWSDFLLERAKACGLPIEEEFDHWGKEPWMHVPMHPKPSVFIGVARAVAKKLGLPITNHSPTIKDKLQHFASWPLYPEIGKALGLDGGGYEFTGEPSPGESFSGDLETFIRASFAVYSRTPQEKFVCAELQDERLKTLAQFL